MKISAARVEEYHEDSQHRYDALWTIAHPYALVRAGEYDMGGDYRIRRPKGSADELLFCPLAGEGIARNESGGIARDASGGIAMKPGFLYRYAEGTPQDYGTSGKRWHFLWLHFHADASWKPLLDWEEIAPGFRRFDLSLLEPSAAKRVVADFAEAVRNVDEGGGLEDELALNNLQHALLLCRRAIALKANPDVEFTERLRSHIVRNLRSRLSTDELAAVVGLSPSRLAHKFKAVTGFSLQDFVESCRLQIARRLISTKAISVKAAAFEVGYDDPLYFSRRFSRRFGITPSQLREREE